MNGQEIALKVLIRQRHMSYEAFCREWDRVSKNVDDAMKGRYPGHAQYYRWLRGELTNKRPYPDACRMLEAMFPGWPVDKLFSPFGEEAMEPAQTSEPAEASGGGSVDAARFADLTAAYTGRAEFMSETPLFELLESATLVRASGVSLNMLTQHYPDAHIRRLVASGTSFQLMFLNPDSEAMRLRETEESYPAGFLGGLTEMNMKIMRERVQDQLEASMRDRFVIALSNDIVRFNIILIDDRFGVFQPYLPGARGVDSPTFVMETSSPNEGFFNVFDQVFTSLWKRASIV
jgi:Domain of unknown function (DUF5919)